MMRFICRRDWMAALVGLLTVLPSGAVAKLPPPLEGQEVAWEQPSWERIRAQLRQALLPLVAEPAGSEQLPPEVALRIDRLGIASPGTETAGQPAAVEQIDRVTVVVDCLAAYVPGVTPYIVEVQKAPRAAASVQGLDSTEINEFVRSNVWLLVGRWLVRQQYYDDALLVLERVEPSEVVDPATLYFYRAVAEHQLVLVEATHQTLATLLARSEALPIRFRELALLMQQDLAGVEQDSLDHISRRMADVNRRLELGQADEPAQQAEREIIEALDKLIQKKEQQQQQQQQARSLAPSGTPMDDSRLAEGKGEGKVDVKEIGHQAGWGNMPPQERERVMQQISRDYPAHYRDLIENYLKRLATEQGPTE